MWAGRSEETQCQADPTLPTSTDVSHCQSLARSPAPQDLPLGGNAQGAWERKVAQLTLELLGPWLPCGPFTRSRHGGQCGLRASEKEWAGGAKTPSEEADMEQLGQWCFQLQDFRGVGGASPQPWPLLSPSICYLAVGPWRGWGCVPAAPAPLLGFFPPPLIPSACSTTLRVGAEGVGLLLRLKVWLEAGPTGSFRGQPWRPPRQRRRSQDSTRHSEADRRHRLCAPAWHHCPHPAPTPAEGVTAKPQWGEKTCPASHTAGQRPDPALALSGYILLWRIF